MAASLLEYIKKLHNDCVAMASKLVFDHRLSEDGLIVATYASMIELLGSYIILRERLQKAGTSSIFRTFLETYAEFSNLVQDPKYYKFLYASYHKEWLRLLDAGAKGNAYLAKIQSHESFNDNREFHASELKALKSDGYAPLTVKERFARAGLQAEYDSVYSFESAGTHNDLREISRRNIESDGDDFKIVMYDAYEASDFHTHLFSLATMTLRATKALHQRLGSGELAHIEKLEAVFKDSGLE